MPSNKTSAKSVLGRHVVNEWGVELGRIHDLAIDPEEGHIAYVVLSFRGTIGEDEKLFAIPWSALTYHAESQEYVLDAPRDSLEEAPGFSHSKWPDAPDPDWSAQIISGRPDA